MATRIMSTAIIEEDVEIGEDCFIAHFVLIRPGCKIGDRTQILAHSLLEGDNIIGSDASLTPWCHCTKGMIVEDKVFIGPGLMTMNDPFMVHLRRHVRPFVLTPPIIKRAARLGGNVTLLPGVVIGENAVVGAGSLVTKDVAPRTIVFGVPAKFIKMVPEEEII
jgi:UDP-2-acetamido-3-amino-2,3-dideoxy-glucuronate N-acetyltransferase